MGFFSAASWLIPLPRDTSVLTKASLVTSTCLGNMMVRLEVLGLATVYLLMVTRSMAWHGELHSSKAAYLFW